MHPGLGQALPGHGAHAPHQIDGQVVQEGELGRGIDDQEAIGLGRLRGDLGEVLGARQAHRDGQAQLRAHAAADRLSDLARRTEQRSCACEVSEGLVDGEPLDERRVVLQHLDGGIAEALILLEVPSDEGELRAQLARPPPGHAAVHPERLGLVGRREHHPAPHGDGLAAQRRVEQLLHRGIEGVEVRVQDGGRCVHAPQSVLRPCLGAIHAAAEIPLEHRKNIADRQPGARQNPRSERTRRRLQSATRASRASRNQARRGLRTRRPSRWRRKTRRASLR